MNKTFSNSTPPSVPQREDAPTPQPAAAPMGAAAPPIPLPTGESASFEAATSNPAGTWKPESPAPAPGPRTRAVAVSEATIRKEFASRALNAEGRAQCDQVRQIFSDALSAIEQRVPDGRYRSMIITKLEEACLLAVKAVSLKPEVQG